MISTFDFQSSEILDLSEIYKSQKNYIKHTQNLCVWDIFSETISEFYSLSSSPNSENLVVEVVVFGNVINLKHRQTNFIKHSCYSIAPIKLFDDF